MREGWRQTTLGEAVEVTMGRQRSPKHAVGEHVVPYLRAANVKDGRLQLDSVLEMNFSPAEQATFSLHPGDVLVTEGCGSIGQLGAAARWDSEIRGVVCFQNTLLRLRAVQGVTDPGFIDVWARHAFSSGLFAGVASGTNIFHIGSTRAKQLPVLLPPPADQRRIVDLLGSLEEAAAALGSAQERARALLAAVLRDHARSVVGSRHSVADLVNTIGGVWGKPPGEQDVDVLALGPRVFTYGTPDVDPTGSPTRSITATQFASRRLIEGDIVLERSGGTAEQPVGRVIYASSDLPRCVPTDFMRLLRVRRRELAEPRYIFWRLWTDYVNGESARYQRRTTGIFNLAVPDYLARELVLPPLGEQLRLIAAADACADVSARQRQMFSALRALRDSLLADLLSGNHEIPDSYDALLEPAS